MSEQIALVFEGVANDPSIRAVILTGQGKSFCTGLDLKIVPSLSEADQKRLLNALNRAFRAVYCCPVPVIDAINGHAMFKGRSIETKRALYRTIVENLEPFGVSPNDIKIILIEVLPSEVGMRGGKAACDLEIGYEVAI